MNELIQKGNVLGFDYPAANYRHVRRRMERRLALVLDVRNMIAQPVKDVTLQIDPELCRGMNLVTAFDLQKQEWRTYYAESMENISLAQATTADEQWSVMLIETAASWSPIERELPDEFVIKDWLAKGIAAPIAEIIAANANAMAMRSGNRGRWAWCCPPNFLNQFELSP